jgi:hypothetical protein
MTSGFCGAAKRAGIALALAERDAGDSDRGIEMPEGITRSPRATVLRSHSGWIRAWIPDLLGPEADGLAGEFTRTENEPSLLVGRCHGFEEYQTTMESGGFCNV